MIKLKNEEYALRIAKRDNCIKNKEREDAQRL